MEFVKSQGFKVNLESCQLRFLSSEEKIAQLLDDPNNIAYDIYDGEQLIGFALLNEFKAGEWFLWNFAIDREFQGQGLGRKVFTELIQLLKQDLNAKTLSTTCKSDNIRALSFFRLSGFEVFEIVDEDDIHETNLKMEL